MNFNLHQSLFTFLVIFSIVIIQGCIPDNNKYDEVNIELSDQNVRHNIDLQDRQEIDSLLALTSDAQPNNRLAVTKAFASIKNTKAIDSLALLLFDPIDEIRIGAAFALGQSYDEQACRYLIDAFVNDDSTEINTRFNAMVLEATGKVCGEDMQKALSNVSTYRPQDDQLLLGQTRALYRYALRDITSNTATEGMVSKLLDNAYPEKVRLIAANYLARSKDINIDSSKYRLATLLNREKNTKIRMALASALGKSNDVAIGTELLNNLDSEKDYRVKCNLIRSLGKYPYELVAPKLLTLLKDKNQHVALTAANYFKNFGIPQLANNYAAISDSITDRKVSATMLEAANFLLPNYYTNSRFRLNNKILENIKETKNPYEKIWFYKALLTHPLNLQQAKDALATELNPIIRSNVVNAIGNAFSSPLFNVTYRTNAAKKYVRTDLYDFLKSTMLQGDAGVLAAASTVLSQPKNSLETLELDHQWLDSLSKIINVPKDLESYIEVKNAHDHLTSKANKTEIKTFLDHRINWTKLEGVSDSSSVRIITNKGDIFFKLYSKDAPASVANFLELAYSNFYDNKAFHRVVPNFVIQGGCSRGDGYGGVDYTLRSEFAPKYYDQEGMVGLASAGPHTEGSQFFITHSPTMHLDGKYTIIGKVTSGMDTVHKIQEGDKIKDVQIIK